jgi:hypothetical protein
MRRLQAAEEEEWSTLCLSANANLCYAAPWLGLELVLLVLYELVLSLPAGLCELVLSLPYVVLLLFLFLCCCLCSYAVHRDLADVFGVLTDVAMVSSPLVERGYHSASIMHNQSGIVWNTGIPQEFYGIGFLEEKFPLSSLGHRNRKGGLIGFISFASRLVGKITCDRTRWKNSWNWRSKPFLAVHFFPSKKK